MFLCSSVVGRGSSLTLCCLAVFCRECLHVVVFVQQLAVGVY